MAAKIKVVQKRSCICESKKVRRVVESMGLNGIGKSKVYTDNNCIRGMINKVKHLVSYELIDN